MLGIVVLLLALALLGRRGLLPALGAERAQVNLLGNGSFEDGLQGWSGDGFRAVEAGPDAFHGARVLEIDPGDDPRKLRTGVLSTPLVLEPERRYRLSIATQASFEGALPRLGISLGRAELYHELAAVQLAPAAPGEGPRRTGWRRLEFDFFASERETALVLGPLSRFAPAVGLGRLWIDDVRIRPLDGHRTLGRDFDLRATLPSTAVTGEELELTLVSVGHRRPDEKLDQTADRSRENPVPLTATFDLLHEGGRGEVPPGVRFETEARKVVRVRFDTPGVHRIALRGEGYEARSNPVRVFATPPERRAYWGDVHIHTSYGHADWYGGDGEQNYLFARDVADLDFAALSEHHGRTSWEAWLDQLAPLTLRLDEPGRFVTFLALETGSISGHWNCYLRGSDPLQMLPPEESDSPARAARYLRGHGGPFLTIPHHFMLLDPVDWRVADHDVLRVAEIYSLHGLSEEAGQWWRHPLHVGPRYEDTRGARGHDFRSALARGHRLGVIACSDDHAGRPGLAGLTCVLAGALERGAVFDALHERRCYATTGARVLLDFSVADANQGGELFLDPGAPLVARIEVHGSAPLARVELLRDGEVVHAVEPRGLDLTETVALGEYDGRSTWMQARVFQVDEHRAWSSPIWIDPRGVPDLVLEQKDLDLRDGVLGVEAWNRGDGPARADVSLHSSALDPRLAAVDETALDELTFCVRLEPVDEGHVRIKAVLFTPRDLDSSFRYSGRIELVDAAGCTVVVDPRGMLERDGNALRWDQEFGVHYRHTESLNGQLSDFELLVATRPGTKVVISPRCDDLPPRLLLGREELDRPDMLLGELHGLAARTRLDRREVEVAAGQAADLEFPVPGPATYLVVLDPEDALCELREDNNSCPLRVSPVSFGQPTPASGPANASR